ncbi:MAG: carboxy-terminal processing protease, carboxyl-terminal processing protease [Candidatus Dadabacteria bacterium CSP1-2]|nr:MAG: carboxy-terminal processing protease, carboxyl-terminal processing protease [Candidatus Dadabacteria bacterium CSP1-2]
MKRWSVIVLILYFAFTGSASEEEATYEGLSNFTRVLDLIERNYVDNVDSEKLAISAIEGMLKTLDPYSAYLTPEHYKELEIGTSGEFGGVGIEISVENDLLTVITPIEGSPAAKAGIKPGDLIIAIDGKSTQGLSVDEAVKSLRGPKGSAVKITIQSQGDKNPREVVLVRDIIYVKSVNSKLLDGRIGYIKLSQFQEKTSEELVKAIEELESGDRGELNGLILDLRNNPGGLLTQAVEVADEFIDEGLIVSVKGRVEDQSTEYYATKKDNTPGYPIIILVNKGSASASEVVAEALQDKKRAIILGTKTFGKGSVQSIIKLEDGSGLKLTTAKFYAPSGRSINQVGVIPDVIVEDSQGKDLQLERAKELIKFSKTIKTAPRG